MGNNEIEIEKRQLHNFDTSANGKRNFGHLSIPEYQRRYNWREDDVNSFLSEIDSKTKTLINKFPHFKHKNGVLENIFKDYSNDFISPRVYFGNIVITLMEDSESPDDIVDGQQRISTFAITLKLLSFYEDKIKSSELFKENEKAFMPMFSKLDKTLFYSSDNGDVMPIISSKNKFDKDYLESVFNLTSLEQIYNATNNTYFKNMRTINEFLKTKDPEELLFFLLSLLTTEFGVVSFTGEERAYELFEALNSKGLQLSPSDLIKNFVFKSLHKTKEDAEKIWKDFILQFTKEDKVTPQEITSFIRSYLMSEKEEYIKKADLFREIKSSFDSKTIAAFIKNLTNMNYRFQSLKNGIWKDGTNLKDKYIQNIYISNLPKIYNSLIMFFLSKEDFEQENFIKMTEYLFKQYFIHWPINNLPSKEIDKKVITVMIEATKMKDINNWEELKIIFNNNILNETFGGYTYKDRISVLKDKDFDDRKNLLVLYKLIRSYKKDSKEVQDIMKDDDLDLEHLLPQSPADDWYSEEGFVNKADADKYIHKIGNTLFIHGTINKSIKNKTFNEKLNDDMIIPINDEASKKLKDSKLFNDEMDWAFEGIPDDWSKEKIETRSQIITDFIIKTKLLDPLKE